MDPQKTNQINVALLQLKAKKEEDLDPFEKHIKSELNDLAEMANTKKGQVIQLEEDILKCIGAMDQTVDLYLKYVESKHVSVTEKESETTPKTSVDSVR